MDHIAANLKDISARIAEAASQAGRSPAEITLIAVSKTNPREAVEAALAAGQLVFGENRLQEAVGKFIPEIPGIELHLVGHLQSNKAKQAAQLFDRIHSIDSFSTAQRLDRLLGEAGRKMKALVQVNLGQEDQKSGIAKDDLLPLLLKLSTLEHLTTDGLMILPPFHLDSSQTAPFFHELRELRDSLSSQNLGGIELKELSMGMTNDFDEAVKAGATFVRVGTAIFGRRDYV
jgi:pyridoxal phosphate enzyme (YggS family)